MLQGLFEKRGNRVVNLDRFSGKQRRAYLACTHLACTHKKLVNLMLHRNTASQKMPRMALEIAAYVGRIGFVMLLPTIISLHSQLSLHSPTL